MNLNFAKIGFVLLLGTVSVVSSCAKYEEGPSFTLLTKKMRLTGDWTVSEMTVDGQSQDISSINTTASINNDGTYTYVVQYSLGTLSYTDTENGTWEFNSDKSSVLFMEDGASTATERVIIKLENKEMKLRTVDGSIDTDLTFTKN